MQRLSGSIQPILQAADKLAWSNRPALIAIDGRSGSGKTLLAQAIAVHLRCPVFHLDHFFLPPELRTQERLSQPGGNVHFERVRDELLSPLLTGGTVCFRPWNCRAGCYDPPVRWSGSRTAVIEGSYALHPALRAFYGLQIFLTCAPEVQRARLLNREGEVRLHTFLERWIPLEETYFCSYHLPDGCDFLLDTTQTTVQTIAP